MSKLGKGLSALAEGHLPKTVKSFSLLFQSDQFLDLTAEAQTKSVLIPAGVTYEKAKEIIYMEAMAIETSIDFIMETKHMDKMKKLMDFTYFFDGCKVVESETTDQLRSFAMAWIGVQLSGGFEKEVENAARTEYKKLVVRAAMNKKKLEDEKKKDNGEGDKALNEAAMMTPEEVVVAAVKEATTKQSKGSEGGNVKRLVSGIGP